MNQQSIANGKRGTVNRLSRTLFIITANLLTLLVMLISVEGCVRIAHPEILPLATDDVFISDGVYGLSPGLTPGVSGKSMGREFSVTSDGFWSYSISGRGVPAWLFLGDSVTMGMGVEPDSTFAGRASGRVSDSLRVVNPSLIGYSSSDYAHILDKLAVSGIPDITRITVFWCLNDAYEVVAEEVAPSGLRQYVGKLSLFIYRHVRAYQWLKKLLFDRPRSYYLFDRSLYDPGSDNFSVAQSQIDEIQRYATDIGAELEFVLLPYEYQFRGGDRVPQDRMIEVLNARQIPFIDVLAAVESSQAFSRDWTASRLYLYGDGIHLSVEGHRLVSDLLIRSLGT